MAINYPYLLTGVAKLGSDIFKPKYAQGTLPRYRGADTHIQGGGFSWRDKLGLFFTRGRDANDCDIEFIWSTDGLLSWEGPAIESDPPPLTGEDYDSKRQHGSSVPGRIAFQKANAPHVQIVRNNRLFILNKGENSEEEDSNSKYRKWSKAIYRWEKKFITLQTTGGLQQNGSQWLTINWPAHGLRGDGSATSDKVRITDMIKVGVGDNSIGGIFPVMLTGTLPVNVLSKDSFAVRSTALNASVTTRNEWFHMGITFVPNGWVQDTYTVGGFSGKSWEEWATANLAATVADPVYKLTSMNLVQGCMQTGSGKWVMPVSGNWKCIAQIKDLFDDTTGSWVQGEYLTRATGDWDDLPGTTDAILTEPMIACDPTPNSNTIVGFARTQSNPYSKKPEFFYSTDAGVNITQYQFPMEFGARSNIAPAIGDDGYIYAFATERLTRYTGDDDVRAAYLIRGKLSEAINPAINVNAFTVYNVGEVDLLAAAESFPPAKANPTITGWNGSATYGAAEPPLADRLWGPGRSSESSRTGLPAVVKHGSWIIWFFQEQELGAFQHASFDYDPQPEGTPNDTFQGDITTTWNTIRWFAIDTRTSANGDFPLSKYGVLSPSGKVA